MILSQTQLASFCRIRDALVAFAFANSAAGSDWLDPAVVDEFVATNPAGLDATDLQLASRWRDAARGPFFVMRHTPSCSILMNKLGTFAVRGTARELSEVVGETPTLVDVTLVPFANHIVCASDPRFAPMDAGRANRADIDATYRDLTDKSVIYSAAVMARTVRAARDAASATPDKAVRARVGRTAAATRTLPARQKKPAAHVAPRASMPRAVEPVPAQGAHAPQPPLTVAGKLAAAMREFETAPILPAETLAPLTRTTVPPTPTMGRRLVTLDARPDLEVAFA